MPRREGEIRNNPRRVVDTWYYKIKDVTIDRHVWIPPKGRGPGKWVADDRNDIDKHVIKKERIVNKTVEIQWQMDKNTTHSTEPPHPLESIEFIVYCKEINVSLKGTDIEALRTAMWSKLDAHFAVKWEEYYLVEIRKAHVFRGSGEGLELSYNDVYKGTAWDGKVIMRQWDGQTEKIKPWPGEFKNELGTVMACIPATELNKAALEEFEKRIDILRERLAEFLRPEVILQTLANLSAISLLPPVPSKEESEEAIEVQSTTTT